MKKAPYEAFEALNPFFEVVMKGLRGLVDGDHYFDTFAEDAVFESRYRFPGWPLTIRGRANLMASLSGYGNTIKLHSGDALVVETKMRVRPRKASYRESRFTRLGSWPRMFPRTHSLDVELPSSRMRTRLKEFGLKGSVQSAETVLVGGSNKSYTVRPVGREVLEDFSSPSANSPDAPLLWEVLKFDSDGRLVEDIDLDRPFIEQKSYRYVYKYDHKGRLVEKVGYQEDSSPDSKDVYTYDQQVKKVEQLFYSGGGRIAARFQFDEHENNTSEEWYREDGGVESRKTRRYEYIEKGNNLERVHYADPENPGYAYRTIYVRDEAGRVREESHHDVDGSLLEKKSFDESGITKRQVWSTLGSTTHFYDNIGRVVEIHSLLQKGSGSPRAVDDRTVCSYDTQGNLTEMITHGPDGSLVRHTMNVFAYDDHGNWIRKIETELSNVWRTEPFPAAYETIREFRRTISYFPEG